MKIAPWRLKFQVIYAGMYVSNYSESEIPAVNASKSLVEYYRTVSTFQNEYE